MRIDGSCLYADDTQVYVATQASDQATAMERLTNCIVKIRDWMASNRLKLNEDKTLVIWLGTRHQLSKPTENTLTNTECYGSSSLSERTTPPEVVL